MTERQEGRLTCMRHTPALRLYRQQVLERPDGSRAVCFFRLRIAYFAVCPKRVVSDPQAYVKSREWMRKLLSALRPGRQERASFRACLDPLLPARCAGEKSKRCKQPNPHRDPVGRSCSQN